jgi:hypothetical protein
MQVIDEGGYGCVIQPPLNCKNKPPTKKSMISKIQTVKHTQYEMQQINKIKRLCHKHKITNCHDYMATDIQLCDPIIPKSLYNTSKCSLLEEGLHVSSILSKQKSIKFKQNKTKKSKFKILNIPFLGTNLQRYLLHNANFQEPHMFVDINNSIIRLYQNFIRLLNQNNFYHNDIKSLNIMVDKHGTFRLIDWGISNKFLFRPIFIFNKPFNYILLSSFFIEKIEELKKKGPLKYMSVHLLVTQYLELIKIKQEINYIAVKELLEFMFPHRVGHREDINPVLVECLVQFAMKYKTKSQWIDIYMHNLDISGVALLYPDILCAISMQKQLSIKLFDGIVAFFTKYILEAYEKINTHNFIQDLNNLNLLVV